MIRWNAGDVLRATFVAAGALMLAACEGSNAPAAGDARVQDAAADVDSGGQPAPGPDAAAVERDIGPAVMTDATSDEGLAADAGDGQVPDASVAPVPDAGEAPGADGGALPDPDAGEAPGTDAGTPPDPDAGEVPGTDQGVPADPDAGEVPGRDQGPPPDPDAGEVPGTDARALADRGAPDAAAPDAAIVRCAEGAERPCDDCAGGLQVCAAGAWQACVRPVEICNGQDDDCDGETDEDYVAEDTTCAMGACAGAGQTSCVGGRVQDTCEPAAVPADEICDGLDNDCDGAVDDGLGTTTCGVGGCLHEQPNCVDGQPVTCDRFEGAVAEICNGADDDCDGVDDNGLLFEDYFPDPDGDGFFGLNVADVQPSCAAWLAAGEVTDGVYTIDPDGADGEPAFEVYCDLSGGGWTRVFYHDVADGYWADDADSLERSADDPLAQRYSILSRLGDFRSSDGVFDLRIDWPDTGIAGGNIWRQSSNPTTDPVAGYVAVDVRHTENGWGGLEYNRFNGATFIDGTVGVANWYYALGATAPWGSPPGVPSYGPSAARVALWVRPDDAVRTVPGTPVSACGPVAGHALTGGDCAPDEAVAHPGADEICDGIDDDCDGQVDEGFVYAEWYPDRDGDGQGASAGSSCASLFAGGATEDGVYTIRPDGHDGPALSVYCDMTTDGGGWTRVFYHDVADGYFSSDADAHGRSEDDPLSPLYSILGHLDAFRSTDGRFVLRINWPETPIEGGNIWSQTSDPTTAPVVGYVALDVDYTSQLWGGLELSDRAETFLDGSVGHASWFYSIGSQVPWSDPPGIPAYQTPAPRVALWVRPDDGLAGGTPVIDCARPDGYVDVAGDCDDTDGHISAGADELCNGVDDNCDGQIDEDCPFGDLRVDVMPQPLHFYPRDLDTNTCTFAIEGELQGVASEVRVTVTRDDLPFLETIADDAPFAVPVTIEAGLNLYDVSIAWSDGGGWWRRAATVEGVVCGDVFLIDGQSNAVASDYHNEQLGDLERNTFVRSYGSAVRDATVVGDRGFGLAVANANSVHGAIGQWGMRLANAVKDAQQVPILVINGAYGGTTVEQHQRNAAQPDDVNTIYGRLLWRAREAGVTGAVRAIFWHQGESNGGQAYETHLALWTAMYEGWLADYPNVEGVFPFQVRAGCGGPTWNRNIHRELPTLLARVLGSMSTTGVDGHDGCHFVHSVYVEWGERMARLVLRDLYHAPVEGNIDAPNPQRATWLSDTQLEIDYGATGGGLVLQEGARVRFQLGTARPSPTPASWGARWCSRRRHPARPPGCPSWTSPGTSHGS